MEHKKILKDKTNISSRDTKRAKAEIEVEQSLPYEEYVENNKHSLYKEIDLELEDVLNLSFFI